MNQAALLPPSYDELIPANHLVRVVNEAVEKIDVSALVIAGVRLNSAFKPPQPNPGASIAESVETTAIPMDTTTPMVIEGVVTATSLPVTSTHVLATTPLPTETPALGIGSTQVSSKDGMVMVYVPAGEFLMGASNRDTNANSDEKPQHKVTLDTYWIDKTEVTNAMYAECVADGAYEPP